MYVVVKPCYVFSIGTKTLVMLLIKSISASQTIFEYWEFA